MLAACTISRDVDLWVTSSSSSLFTIGLYCHFPADYGPALSQLTTLTAHQILERHNHDRYRHNLQRRLDVDLALSITEPAFLCFRMTMVTRLLNIIALCRVIQET